jgi:hypothetical protein
LPAGLVSIVAVIYLIFRVAYDLAHFVYLKIIEIKTIGFSFELQPFTFDPFFISTESLGFVFIFIYSWIIISILLGKRMTEGKWGPYTGVFYFLFIFALIAPFWLLQAVYNTIIKRRPAWR